MQILMPPSYFYHIAFELRASPSPLKPDTSELPQSTYLPPPKSNVFTSELPAHELQAWIASPKADNRHKRSKTASSSAELTSNPPSTHSRGAYLRRFSYLSNDRTYSPVPLYAGKAIGNDGSELKPFIDQRFGRISILSIDMALKEPATTTAGSGSAAEIAASSGLATKGTFVYADPKNTELGWGVVHLYRDGQETPGLYDDLPSKRASGEPAHFDINECTTLCILAVPSYMMPSDFLGWVGEQTREQVSHFRLIRTGKVNRYMVLMKFRDAIYARRWQKEWNGKLFNSMEVCQPNHYSIDSNP
jgi:BRCA1-associated protein